MFSHGRTSHLQPSQSTCMQKRAALRVLAAKGFGSNVESKPKPAAKPKKKRAVMTKEEAVKEAVRLSEVPGIGPSNGKAPPEGAEGRVDYAQVKNWRAGQNKDIGDLEVESFLPGGQEGGREVPFYNELAYASVQHQRSGQIEDLMYNQFEVPAVRKEGASLSFRMEDYVQYLVDLQAQHHAVEVGVAEALAFHKEPSNLRSALECYSEARGLDRSLEIAADLTNLDHAASSSGGDAPSVSPAAASYVARLHHIGQGCLEDTEEGRIACLKLMTHAFCAQFVLLTQGAKLGSSNAEKLNLFKKKAVNVYRRYPQDKCGKDPFVALKNNTNQAGTVLNPEERMVMRHEVGIALAHNIQTTSTLLE